MLIAPGAAGTLAVLTRARPEDLDGPTPCVSWDVRALVNHFVGTARWWAATSYGICVLTVTSAGIRRVSSFGDPKLVTVFGFRPGLA
jgi:hypothetical protein